MPWATLAAVAVGIVVVAAGQARAATVAGRTIGIVAGVASLFGVYEHIAANFRSCPLDFRYTDRWRQRQDRRCEGGEGPPSQHQLQRA